MNTIGVIIGLPQLDSQNGMLSLPATISCLSMKYENGLISALSRLTNLIYSSTKSTMTSGVYWHFPEMSFTSGSPKRKLSARRQVSKSMFVTILIIATQGAIILTCYNRYLRKMPMLLMAVVPVLNKPERIRSPPS